MSRPNGLVSTGNERWSFPSSSRWRHSTLGYTKGTKRKLEMRWGVFSPSIHCGMTGRSCLKGREYAEGFSLGFWASPSSTEAREREGRSSRVVMMLYRRRGIPRVWIGVDWEESPRERVWVRGRESWAERGKMLKVREKEKCWLGGEKMREFSAYYVASCERMKGLRESKKWIRIG